MEDQNMSEKEVIVETVKSPTLTKKDLGLWVFLCLITFGVFYIIWTIQIVKQLNYLEGRKEKSLLDLILSLIIPFYSIMFLYKLSRRTDALCKGKVNMIIDEFPLSCLVISIIPVFSLIVVALMQEHINRLLEIPA
jgi:hypothetical protein